MNIRCICCFSFIALASISTNAQRGQLNNAVGLRFGHGLGVSAQRFITSQQVFEGIVSSRQRGFALTGLYELHTQILDAKGFKWYFGFGAHAGTYNQYSFERNNTGGARGTSLLAGGDGIIGLEYYMRHLPVQFSADWKPEYNLVGLRGWKTNSMAISARYRFQ